MSELLELQNDIYNELYNEIGYTPADGLDAWKVLGYLQRLVDILAKEKEKGKRK